MPPILRNLCLALLAAMVPPKCCRIGSGLLFVGPRSVWTGRIEKRRELLGLWCDRHFAKALKTSYRVHNLWKLAGSSLLLCGRGEESMPLNSLPQQFLYDTSDFILSRDRAPTAVLPGTAGRWRKPSKRHWYWGSLEYKGAWERWEIREFLSSAATSFSA